MNKWFPLGLLTAVLLLSGCLTSSNSSAGGLLGVTVPNTTVDAIINAAQSAFGQAGYSVGPVDYPNSISFDKPAGAFGQAMWGGYNQSTGYRARLNMIPLSGNDYRLSVKVFAVNDAGQAGFEDSRPLVGPWSAEFLPILNKIKAQAAGAAVN
jgi:hypothetical protein